jgi:hypothetical protein
MPQFDQERLIKLVSELRTSVNCLRHLSKLSQDGFASDPDKIAEAQNTTSSSQLNPALICAIASLHETAFAFPKITPTPSGSWPKQEHSMASSPNN